MRVADAGTLFDHLYWTRDRVLDAAGGMDDAAWTSTDTVTSRGLQATLVHELDVQWSWRERLKGADWEEWGPDAELTAANYPTVATLVEHWQRDEAVMREWLAGLTDGDLEAPPVRDEDPQPLWQYLMHLYAHGLQQFNEAAVLLTRAGHSPGDIGFLEFVQATGLRRTPASEGRQSSEGP